MGEDLIWDHTTRAPNQDDGISKTGKEALGQPTVEKILIRIKPPRRSLGLEIDPIAFYSNPIAFLSLSLRIQNYWSLMRAVVFVWIHCKLVCRDEWCCGISCFVYDMQTPATQNGFSCFLKNNSNCHVLPLMKCWMSDSTFQPLTQCSSSSFPNAWGLVEHTVGISVGQDFMFLLVDKILTLFVTVVAAAVAVHIRHERSESPKYIGWLGKYVCVGLSKVSSVSAPSFARAANFCVRSSNASETWGAFS